MLSSTGKYEAPAHCNKGSVGLALRVLLWFDEKVTLGRVAERCKGHFPLGGIFRAERNFLLCFDAHARLIGI